MLSKYFVRKPEYPEHAHVSGIDDTHLIIMTIVSNPDWIKFKFCQFHITDTTSFCAFAFQFICDAVNSSQTNTWKTYKINRPGYNDVRHTCNYIDAMPLLVIYTTYMIWDGFSQVLQLPLINIKLWQIYCFPCILLNTPFLNRGNCKRFHIHWTPQPDSWCHHDQLDWVRTNRPRWSEMRFQPKRSLSSFSLIFFDFFFPVLSCPFFFVLPHISIDTQVFDPGCPMGRKIPINKQSTRVFPWFLGEHIRGISGVAIFSKCLRPWNRTGTKCWNLCWS